MNFRTATLHLIFASLSLVSFSQPAKTDSLKRLLAKSYSAEERFELQLQLADNYGTLNPDSSLFFANNALSIAKKQADQINVIKAEFYQASYNYNLGKPEDALAMAEKNMSALQGKPEQLSLLAQYTALSGRCLMKLNQFKQALERFY